MPYSLTTVIFFGFLLLRSKSPPQTDFAGADSITNVSYEETYLLRVFSKALERQSVASKRVFLRLLVPSSLFQGIERVRQIAGVGLGCAVGGS